MSGHDRNRFGRRGPVWVSLAIAALCTSCATHNAALDQARVAYDRARQDTEIAKYAPVALSEAGQALSRAERASNHDEVSHLAYIAQRKVEMAEALAEGKAAESQSQELLGQRDKMLLEIRNREVQELQAQNTARGMMVTLGDVLFETAKAGLKPGAQQKLYQLVSFLEAHPDRKVVIEGHTDSRGSESYNEDLSQRRAEAVQDFLIRNGIDPARITAQGYGEAYPVASNGTPAGRLQNRRVEIYLPTAGEDAAGRRR
jgi:OOP family OmpA-OmpF porin